MSEPVYKICDAAAWQAASRRGRYEGSPVDVRDGFIHFSSRAQLAGTAEKHFAGQDNLVLVTVNPERLGAALKWEPSRGGALFPHLYGALEMDAILSVEPLPLGADGRHRFPDGGGQ